MSAFPKEALTPVTGLPGKEMSQADVDYQKAMEEIKASLDRRSGLDPSMLALAQGFFAPTKSGGFGESISNAVANYLPVQQAEDKRIQENAGLRLQLAQAGREQEQSNAAMQYLQNRKGGAGGAPAAGGAGAPTVEYQGQTFTPEDISVIKIGNPKLGKILEEELKIKLDMIATQPGGVVNKLTGVYTPFGGKAMVERNIHEVGVVKMPEQDAMELDVARRAGDAENYWKIVDRNTTALGKPKPPAAAPTAPGAPAAAAAPAGTRMTQAEIEAQAAAAKRAAEKTAESEVERTQTAINAAADADSRLNSATVVKSLMNQEGMDQVVGVLEKPGLLPGLLKGAEEGVSAGRGFGLSLPQVRQIYTQNKISLPRQSGETNAQYREREEAVISRLQQLSSEFAKITFGYRSMAKGQGAISNLENNIFQSMGPTVQDSYQTIMAKTAHAAARAEADKKIANALTDSNMSVDKFKKTNEYKDIQRNYDNQLSKIYGGVQVEGRPIIGRTTTGPVTAESLRQRLGGQ
jgi:hypothetical protein